MKTKFYYTLFFISIFNVLCFSQRKSFVHYRNINGGTYENKNFIIPKYEMKIDKNKRIFYKDSLIFTPKNKFKYCTYHFYNNRFLLITGLTKEQYQSNINSLLPRDNIIIIDTGSWDKLHYFKLNEADILDVFNYDGGIQLNAVRPEDIIVFNSENGNR